MTGIYNSDANKFNISIVLLVLLVNFHKTQSRKVTCRCFNKAVSTDKDI